MMDINDIEIRLAHLRGLCVHDWQITKNEFDGSYHISCSKCPKTHRCLYDDPIPFAIDEPIANDVGLLIDFIQEKKLAYKLEDTKEDSVAATIFDTNKRAYLCVQYSNYPTPKEAVCIALGSCVLEVLS